MEIKSDLLDRVNSFGLQLDQIMQKVDGAEHKFTVEKAGSDQWPVDFLKEGLKIKDPEC